MPMRRNLVQCSVVSTYDTAIAYAKNEDFNSGGTGGFTANTGTVSNPTGNQLHMTANWASKPLATTSVYLVNGRSYTLNLDIVGFSVVSGFSHTVRVRVVLPGAAFNTDFTTTGTKTITFTSNTTGYVNIEIRSIISPPTGVYSGNPYIDIDNFKVSWDSAFTSSDTICVSKSGYRYGFNGMEKVDEVSGEGNGYDFGARMYDGRLGRWFSVDPFSTKYAGLSSYHYSNNSINICRDGNGKDFIIVIDDVNKTITIKATYYTEVSEETELARDACLFFNSLSGIYSLSTQYCDYIILFELEVKELEPILFNDERTSNGDNSEEEAINDPAGNSIVTFPGLYKIGLSGFLRFGQIIELNYPKYYEDNNLNLKGTVIHEMFHSLGVTHAAIGNGNGGKGKAFNLNKKVIGAILNYAGITIRGLAKKNYYNGKSIQNPQVKIINPDGTIFINRLRGKIIENQKMKVDNIEGIFDPADTNQNSNENNSDETFYV